MDMKYFKIEEFACPCCGVAKMDEDFLSTVDQIRDAWGKPLIVNSGYRCAAHNEAIHGAPNSNHCKGLAVDFSDKTGELWDWLLAHADDFDIYLEARSSSPTWAHVQPVPPRSGQRVFRP